MNVEKLIGELSEHRKLMWTVDMKPGVPRCHAVPLDLIVEAAAALAKLQAERDEAREALRPFAEKMADIGEDEADDDGFRNMSLKYCHAPVITVGHFRAASRALGGGE